MQTSFLLFAALAAIAAGVSSPTSEFSSVYHQHGFSVVGRASPLASHTLYIGLPLNNVAAVQAYHDDCSNPSSPNFQKWPSETQLLSLTAPNPSLVSSVRAWVQSLGPHAVEEPVGNGAAMAVTASVSTLEAAFQTQLYEYAHPTFGSVIRSGGSHVLPHAFQGADIAVSGIADMPTMHTHGGRSHPHNRPETSGFETSTTLRTKRRKSIRAASTTAAKAKTSTAPPTTTVRTTTATTTTVRTTTATTTTAKTTTARAKTKHSTTNRATTAREAGTTYPAPFPTYQQYSTQGTEPPPPIDQIIYFLPGYDYIENIFVPSCPDGQPFFCNTSCATPADPVAIQAQVIPCESVINLNQNCTNLGVISDSYFQDIIDVTGGGECFCISGLDVFACPVKVPAAPNSLNQICYRTLYSDGFISDPVCAYPQATVTLSTPQLIRDLYNIPQGITSSPNQKQAVLEFYRYGLGMYPPDLDFYLNFMGLASTSPLQIFSHNPYPPYHTDGEGSLDLQILNAISLGAQNVYLNAAPRVPYWYVWASIVGGSGKYSIQTFGKGHVPLPNVLSISWGGPVDTVTYLQLSETWLMILTTRGTTILVASGDDGYQSGAKNCTNPSADYPSSSAYVTSVGATSLSNAGQAFCSAFVESCGGKPMEIVCSGCGSNIITSGGGYSKPIPAVPYMSPLQDIYAANVKAGNFFPSNLEFEPPVFPQQRGYPDVALLAANYPTILNLALGNYYYGTSCSTPIMAGMVTLWNTILQPYNRTMGSMNHFLYQMAAKFPQVFNDVVLGDTSCGVVQHTASDDQQCPTGFYATPGWFACSTNDGSHFRDPATGLGSPNFGLLLKLLLDPTGASLYT